MVSQLLIDNLPEIIRDETETVFLTSCGVDVNSTDQNTPSQEDGTVFCTISVSGDLSCSFFLCMPFETIKNVIPLFLKVEIPQIDDLINDVAGELLNLITGGIKSMISIQGLSFQLSVPSVIPFDAQLVENILQGEIKSFGFDSQIGPLWTGFIRS